MNNELPPTICDLIAQVTKKTKLRKTERADVARELTSHFQEALASGKSPHEVVLAYGDARTSALNLRAAAIAKRSTLDRALGLTFTWSVRAALFCVIAYAAVAIYFNFQTPKVSFDAVKRFRDSLPVATSPDQSAWSGYREALVGMGMGADDPQSKSSGAVAANDAPLPNTEKWASAIEWIAAHQQQIAAFCAATKRPIFGYPVGVSMSDTDAALLGKETQENSRRTAAIDVNDLTQLPVVEMLLPQLATMRTASRLLATDMMLAVQEGDGERATRDAEAMIALSIHLQEGRIVIGDLVGMSIRSNAANHVVMALEWNPSTFTDAQLGRLQTALRSVPPAMERPDFTSERLMFEDVVQRFYTDDGNGDGWFAPQMKQIQKLEMIDGRSGRATDSDGTKTNIAALALISIGKPIAAFVVAGRKETLEQYDACIRRIENASEGSLSDSTAALAVADQEFEENAHSHRMRYFLAPLLMPELSKIALYFKNERAVRDATTTAIATELYYRANGRWPASAAELAPLCDGKAPQDPWSNTPILMETDANGFRMWSVGRDGIDHHGNIDQSSNSPKAESDRASDWLWFAPAGNPNEKRDGKRDGKLDRWSDHRQ